MKSRVSSGNDGATPPVRTEQEGFRVYAGTFVDEAGAYGSSFSRTYDIEVDPAVFVSMAEQPYERWLFTTDELKITFPAPVLNEDADFLGIAIGDQISWLQLQKSPALFTTAGRLLGPESVQLSSYWSIRRVCQLLPHEYQPSG